MPRKISPISPGDAWNAIRQVEVIRLLDHGGTGKLPGEPSFGVSGQLTGVKQIFVKSHCEVDKVYELKELIEAGDDPPPGFGGRLCRTGPVSLRSMWNLFVLLSD
jgi:hypothetical protein